MFIGYPPNHEGDCYWMWNPVTNGVHTTRDVIWLKRMFYNKEMGQNILINPELLPDVEEEGTTGLPTWEGGASDDEKSVDVRMNFLRELKKEGLIVTDWISGESNPSDLFTMNLAGPAFEKHTAQFVGMDQYMDIIESALSDS
jgi:hypothetical protein